MVRPADCDGLLRPELKHPERFVVVFWRTEEHCGYVQAHRDTLRSAEYIQIMLELCVERAEGR